MTIGVCITPIYDIFFCFPYTPFLFSTPLYLCQVLSHTLKDMLPSAHQGHSQKK